MQAFEFGAAVEGRSREIAAGVPGVTQSGRVCVAFAVYRKPSGKHQVVALVGADPDVGARFPVPGFLGRDDDISPDSVMYDQSDRDLIEVASLPTLQRRSG